MKHFVLCLVSLLFTICATGQNTRNIGIELLGSNSVRYDARFRGNHGLGYSVGVGYGYDNSNVFGSKTVRHDALIPAEVNYLFGKNNNHFVLGAGGAFGLEFKHVKSPAAIVIEEDGSSYTTPPVDDHDVDFGFVPFLDIAYRYQKPKGFSFTAGFKPHPSQLFWPYIGFGWSF